MNVGGMVAVFVAVLAAAGAVGCGLYALRRPSRPSRVRRALTRLGLLGLFALAAGCEIGWSDVPGAPLRPVSEEPTVDADAWAAMVAHAANAWNAALSDYGCPVPFGTVSADEGHEIRLVTPSAWDHPGSVGITYSEGIDDSGHVEIKYNITDPGQYTVLVHELGHAIGLEHADPDLGASVMTPYRTAWKLVPRDVAAAACVLGCGPCDGEDPYDGS